MDFVALVAASAVVVNILTSLIKAVPVEFTSKYPAWVAGILSVIAAFIVRAPEFTLGSIWDTVVFAFFTAVLAGLAYNQYTSRLSEKA